MRLIGKILLDKFRRRHADVRSQINSWEAEVEEAIWDTPTHLKKRYPKASLIKGGYVVFDLCGNKYRLLTLVNYKNGIVLVKNIGNHKEYNNWKII